MQGARSPRGSASRQAGIIPAHAGSTVADQHVRRTIDVNGTKFTRARPRNGARSQELCGEASVCNIGRWQPRALLAQSGSDVNVQPEQGPHAPRGAGPRALDTARERRCKSTTLPRHCLASIPIGRIQIRRVTNQREANRNEAGVGPDETTPATYAGNGWCLLCCRGLWGVWWVSRVLGLTRVWGLGNVVVRCAGADRVRIWAGGLWCWPCLSGWLLVVAGVVGVGVLFVFSTVCRVFMLVYFGGMLGLSLIGLGVCLCLLLGSAGWLLYCLCGVVAGWLFSGCFCLESLILAQDERWRRA